MADSVILYLLGGKIEERNYFQGNKNDDFSRHIRRIFFFKSSFSSKSFDSYKKSWDKSLSRQFSADSRENVLFIESVYLSIRHT